MTKRALVAMSGGVDSSVAAYLLLRDGYDVAGVTMEIWGEGSCGTAREAAQIAEALGIKHYSLDLRDEFKRYVIEPFIGEYLRGRTPNPCVLCNNNIKWDMLLKKAYDLGFDNIATGHYANIARVNGRYSLKSAEFTQKDQSYALYRLSQEQLERTLFPLGAYRKDDVRKIAEAAGLDVYDKPESQDICFVENNDYAGFISEHTGITEEKGEFVLPDGTVLGVHNGISNYTIGQRKGLGISYSEPLFVQRIDAQSNKVVLGSDAELYSREFTIGCVNYLSVPEINEETEYIAKIRYAHKGARCFAAPFDGAGDKLSCRFSEPQRAITPGQSAVFYDESGVIIAGGIILG